MARGYPDYRYFSFPVAASEGGTGLGTLTQYGVLFGNASSPLVVSAAGNPYEVLRVPAAGGFPVFGPVKAIRYADQYPGADASAQITAAIADLPATGGTVDARGLEGAQTISATVVLSKPATLLLGGATYSGSVSPLFSLTHPGASLVGLGRNSATVLSYTGSGDAIQMNAGMSGTYMNGRVVGLTIAGTSAAVSGIHHINTIGAVYDDLIIQNFTGASAAGMWFDNQGTGFSERTKWGKVALANNTKGLRFTNNGDPSASVSFMYARMHQVELNVNSNQIGISVEGPHVILAGCSLAFSGNVSDPSGGAKFLSITGGAIVQDNAYSIHAEQTVGSGAVGIYVDATSILAGQGDIALGGFTTTFQFVGGSYISLGPIIPSGTTDPAGETILNSAATAPRYWTFPDYTDTAVGINSAQTLQGKVLADTSAPTKVGAGTVTPVAQAISNLSAGPSDADGGTFAVGANTAFAQDVGGSVVFFGQYQAGAYAGWSRVRGQKENATSGNYSGYIGFDTRATGGVLTEKMRIASDGKVGIGTNSPGEKLDVVGGNIRTDGQLKSTLSTGTAPLDVTSTTKVSNLNADRIADTQITNAATAGLVPIGTGAGTAAWGTPDGAAVYNSAVEAITSAVLTPLTFDSEYYDNGGLHSTSSNTSQLTAQKAGKYLISGQVLWASTPTARELKLVIRKGGTVYLAMLDEEFINTSGPSQNISALAHLAAGEYVELLVNQNTGSNLNCGGLASAPWFAMQWLGP